MPVIYAEDRTAGDAAAENEGYTHRVYIDSGSQSGDFLVRKDDDLDGEFKAWGVDWQEWTMVRGWVVHIEHY